MVLHSNGTAEQECTFHLLSSVVGLAVGAIIWVEFHGHSHEPAVAQCQLH